MTSSTKPGKPGVHNVSQRRQKSTQPQPYLTSSRGGCHEDATRKTSPIPAYTASVALYMNDTSLTLNSSTGRKSAGTHCRSSVLSVCPSVCEGSDWRIIANLGFKFRSKFTAHYGRSPQCAESQCMLAHCGRGACREEGRGHLALCYLLLRPLVFRPINTTVAGRRRPPTYHGVSEGRLKWRPRSRHWRRRRRRL